MAIHFTWVFAAGVLGNIISFIVFLAPLPTFYQIYRRKSTEGFQSLPYVIALFSAMLLIYYALLKGHETLLITINTVGCIIETFYIVLFLIYAPRRARILTVKGHLILNVFGFGMILMLTNYLVHKEDERVKVVGWICLAFSISVFAAPLGIMRRVILTRSVEFMPIYLSIFLTLSAIAWFFYGLLQHDFYIYVPNVLGFVFGVIQMGLYFWYKNARKVEVEVVEEEPKFLELTDHMIVACPELNIPVILDELNNHGNNVVLEEATIAKKPMDI